jgi:site-specific recombinase XerD
MDRRLLDSRILPVFGNREIGSIKMADCTRFRDALMKDGLRPATVTKVFGLFAVIMRFAAKRRYITDNPAADIAMPTNTSAEVPAFEGRYLTPPELEKLVQQVAWFNPT